MATLVDVNPWWYFLAFLPICFTGGYCALLTGLFCYVADVASHDTRAMRLILAKQMVLLNGALKGWAT